VDLDPETDLEAAIADAALQVMRLEKYRFDEANDLALDRRLLSTLGRQARRAHRTADEPSVALVHAEVRALSNRLHTRLDRILRSPHYRAAVEAHARGDHATLQPLLLQLFDALAPAPASGEIFASIPWSSRRGPRPADDLVRDVEALREDGFKASGDPLDPGVDPELSAVAFRTAWPDGAPIAVACRLEDLPFPGLLGPAEEVLVHQDPVKLPFTVVFQLERDAVDEWVGDTLAYRGELEPRFVARGFTTRSVPVPAVP